MLRETVCLLLSASFFAASQNTLPILQRGSQTHSSFRKEEGWQPLLNGQGLKGWRTLDGNSPEWFTTRDVRWDQGKNILRFGAAASPGSVLLNGAKGRTSNLITDQKFGDVELYLEFLIPKDSNSGVYLHGLYEVQIKDSYGVPKPTVHDCGAIYERWINGKGVGGAAPLKNAARVPGEWQSYAIWFRAPRFDSQGRKVGNACFLRVLLNGILVQNNVEVEGPTRAAMNIPEALANPLLLQGDHGPVAFRSIYIRPLRPAARN